MLIPRNDRAGRAEEFVVDACLDDIGGGRLVNDDWRPKACREIHVPARDSRRGRIRAWRSSSARRRIRCRRRATGRSRLARPNSRVPDLRVAASRKSDALLRLRGERLPLEAVSGHARGSLTAPQECSAYNRA